MLHNALRWPIDAGSLPNARHAGGTTVGTYVLSLAVPRGAGYV